MQVYFLESNGDPLNCEGMQMNTRLTIGLVVASTVVGFAVVSFRLVAPASASPVTAVATMSTYVIPILGGTPEYIGAKKCKKCHLKSFKSWETSGKAKSMDSLKPGNKADVKSKYGLDPTKDYTTDGNCLACHTTGYGKEGGYALVEDEKAAKKMEALAGIGCESCHGPGGTYIDLHEEIMKLKRKYKSEEMHAAGMWRIDKDRCASCHNEKSPTYDKDNPIDVAKVKNHGAHARFPLEQREE